MPDNDADALNAAITTGMIMNFIVSTRGEVVRGLSLPAFLGAAIKARDGPAAAAFSPSSDTFARGVVTITIEASDDKIENGGELLYIGSGSRARPEP